MDSSDLQSTNSNGSQSSDIADNSSMMTLSKRDIFLSTYRRQNFTFPNSMMHYIAKNPKNTKVYQKMVERCKYFYIKNPILIISDLIYDRNGGKTYVKNTWENIDMNKLSSKLWINDQLSVYPENLGKNIIASSIIPKIYKCDFKYLYLKNQFISLNEFIFLCSSVKKLRLNEVTVKNDCGTVVPIEKLVEQFPKVKRFEFTFTSPSINTSKKTFKDIWKNPHLSNYDSFNLFNIPEDFDIDCFYSFMKKNKKTRVSLEFSDQISEESKTRLEAIIDEIIGAENHEHKIPYIDFPGLDTEKINKLRRIYFQ